MKTSRIHYKTSKNREDEVQMKPLTKFLLIGCGTLVVGAIAVVVWIGTWMFTGPESGVNLGNEMADSEAKNLPSFEPSGFRKNSARVNEYCCAAAYGGPVS